MTAYRALPGILLACALVAGVAACGSSGSSSAPKTTAPSTPARAASSSSTAQARIKADWMAFLNAKTPVAKRISLL